MTIKALPQINGNSKDDFADAWVSLHDAAKAIHEASAKISLDVLNGRNYQHLRDEAASALTEDRQRLRGDFQTVLALLSQISAEILEAHNR